MVYRGPQRLNPQKPPHGLQDFAHKRGTLVNNDLLGIPTWANMSAPGRLSRPLCSRVVLPRGTAWQSPLRPTGGELDQGLYNISAHPFKWDRNQWHAVEGTPLWALPLLQLALSTGQAVMLYLGADAWPTKLAHELGQGFLHAQMACQRGFMSQESLSLTGEGTTIWDRPTTHRYNTPWSRAKRGSFSVVGGC